MDLSYLLFDATDDESGAWSFDAMATVLPARLPAVLDEVGAVLRWAWREFGAPSTLGDEGGWDFDLHAMDETSAPLDITFDGEQARMPLPPGHEGRVTITLTLSGPSAFGSAFREAFSEAE
jgi:hypothetical protein